MRSPVSNEIPGFEVTEELRRVRPITSVDASGIYVVASNERLAAVPLGIWNALPPEPAVRSTGWYPPSRPSSAMSASAARGVHQPMAGETGEQIEIVERPDPRPDDDFAVEIILVVELGVEAARFGSVRHAA